MASDVVMFPGQGSQRLGMGEEVFDAYPRLCDRADEIVGYSLRELCLKDPHGLLNETSYTQQAIYFVSCLMYLAYAEEYGDEPVRCVTGHSLGLYPALFAAGVFDLFEGLEIVSKRGALMQEARDGAMVAVLGPQANDIDEHLVQLEFFDVDVANYNRWDQVVLSAAKPRLDELVPRLEEIGHRCVWLPVSGAFHSRHMEPARREFARFLREREFAPPTKTVVSTTSGRTLGAQHLLEEMVFQLVKPVRWWQTVTYLARTGHKTFEEIGPGRVLTKLSAEILGDESSPQAEPRK
ncbi:ACP S-malonyltransferase [Streptomyces cellostaticus]|uniref:Malonyl CoA-acyl carrier protein transacylase n=1 Tax=Streptomyces cellostaticus TaxID=67285 RepID=A0A124HC73_9ACTN|nr:ACP S-malonyltransferase [Streptomyces cellostaticus]KUM93543.1 ACP S-malonyltransferase [Streptomyces cellostaticus]GHI04298.1 polyketide biosynthesis malonyl CoA-acyl carrier protein transacylase PksC [Streptomyces cellostaticus]